MQDERNEFISGEIEGLRESAAPPVTTTKRAQSLGERLPAKADAHEAIAERVKSDADKTLEEFYNRPLADPQAQVLCRDEWGRKVEKHADGWEASQGITRRFTDNQVVYTTFGLMASTLRKGSVYGGQPTYVQSCNSPTMLDSWADEIDMNGIIIGENTKKSIPPPIRCRVFGGGEVTIGKCPMYQIVVDDPRYSITGLQLLQFPNHIVDDQGIDGYGNKYKGKDFYIESDIARDLSA